MTDQQLLVETHVALADMLVDDYDVIDFMQTLAERSVELLGVSAAGIMLADADGRLRHAACSSEQMRLVELLELQLEEGPCFDAFHHQTAPSDWLEGLIKAYVGDGLAADFYVEIAQYLDGDTRRLVVDSLADAGYADFVVDRVGRAIEQDPRVAGRLALWGRRLMGEALSQAQRVAAERDSLAALLAGGVDWPGMDLAALGRMFTRLTENHAKRMAELGLAS